MSASYKNERVETTLGDLVVALSDAAFELYGNDRAAYLVASLALEEILKNAPIRKTDTAEVSGDTVAEGTVFH